MAIELSESREHVLEFLRKNNVGVLATVDAAGKPHAATIYFTYDQELNFFFITKRETQKSRNLQGNIKAAIAVHDAPSQTTLQGEGTVVEVANTENVEWVFHDIWRIALSFSSTTPPPQAHLIAGGYVVYKLIMPALRLATFVHKDPADYDKIFEVVSTRPA